MPLPPPFSMSTSQALSTMPSTVVEHDTHNKLITALHEPDFAEYDYILSSFEKWQTENAEGLYIQDLEVIVKLLDLILERGLAQVDEILSILLSVCGMPLMELKANERLSHKGMERIENYLAKLLQLWDFVEICGKIKLGKCFRCIANGGVDPSLLRSDHKEWIPDGQRLKVTDKMFVQQRLRAIDSMNVFVREFINATDVLNYTTADDGDVPQEQDPQQSGDNQIGTEQSYEDELEMYGVPRDLTRTADTAATDGTEGQPNEKVSLVELSIEEGGDENGPSSPVKGGGFLQSPKAVSWTSRTNGASGKESPSKRVSAAVSRDLSQVMLDLCLDLSADPENAAIMCTLGICDGAIALIEKDSRFNPRENRLSFAVELMWNALEHFLDKVKADSGDQADDPDRLYLLQHEHMIDLNRAVAVLQDVLNYRLHDGYRLSDKELRNEVVILLTMLVEFPSTVGCFMQSQLLSSVLVTYACYEEMGRASWPFFPRKVARQRNFATASDVDLEFKKELWFLVSACVRSSDPDALLCVASSPLLATMLLYIEQDSFEPGRHHHGPDGLGTSDDLHQNTYSAASLTLNDSDGHSPHHHSQSATLNDKRHGTLKTGTVSASITSLPGQEKKSFLSTLPLSKLRELQLLAMTFLVHNAPKMLGEFERLDGPAKVVALTLKLCDSAVPEHKSLIFHSLILLNRCLISSLSVRRLMVDRNLVQTFLFLFDRSDHEETRAQAVRLISSLCANDNVVCQKQLRLVDGVSHLIAPIQRYVTNRPPLVGTRAGIELTLSHGAHAAPCDPLENPFGGEISILIVSILDCLDNAVVGNRGMEAHFADREGVDALLDLLEISPFVLRIQVLRLISNMLGNPRLVTYLNAWRSPKTLRSAAQVLCHCWMDEEVRLDGERRENGIICDIYNPLGNHAWPAAIVNNVPQNGSSAIDVAKGRSPSGLGARSFAEGAELDTVGFSTTVASPFAPTSSTLLPGGKSVTVTKLATAILAGRNATQTNLPVEVCEQALQKDTRVVIASALEAMGVFELYSVQNHLNPLKPQTNIGLSLTAPRSVFCPSVDRGSTEIFSPAASKDDHFEGGSYNAMGQRGVDLMETTFENQSMDSPSRTGHIAPADLGLTPRDRQVLCMARKYHALRCGDWWRDVKAAVTASGIVPIDADIAWMDAHLDVAFDAAQATQLEQMELHDEDQRLRQQSEDTFIDQILVKMNQQIKAEWLKRNARMKGVTSKRNKK